MCRHWVSSLGRAGCSSWTTRHRTWRRRSSGTMPTCTSQAKLSCQDTRPRKTHFGRVIFQPACTLISTLLKRRLGRGPARDVRGSGPHHPDHRRRRRRLGLPCVLHSSFNGRWVTGGIALHHVSPPKVAFLSTSPRTSRNCDSKHAQYAHQTTHQPQNDAPTDHFNLHQMSLFCSTREHFRRPVGF